NRDRAAMAPGDFTPALADVGDYPPLARLRHPDSGRPVAAHAPESRLPSPLPLAARLPDRTLAQWSVGRLAHGAGARRLLTRLLLVSDGAPLRWRNHDPVLDRRHRGLRAARKGDSAWPLALPGGRSRAACMGRRAD